MAKRNTVADVAAPIIPAPQTTEAVADNVVSAVKWPNSRARSLATVRAGAAFDAAKDLSSETSVDNSAEIAALQAQLNELTEQRKALRERIEALSPSRSAQWHERALLLLEARLWRAGLAACQAFVAFVEGNSSTTLPTSHDGVVAVNAMLGNYCAFQRVGKEGYAVSPGMIALAASIRKDLGSVKLSV